MSHHLSGGVAELQVAVHRQTGNTHEHGLQDWRFIFAGHKDDFVAILTLRYLTKCSLQNAACRMEKRK